MDKDDLEIDGLDMGDEFAEEKDAFLAKQGQVAAEKISETLKDFKKSTSGEKRLFVENVDSEFWVAICFQSREQKDEFLRLARWEKLGDKYLDGLEVAEAMKIKIADLTPPIPRQRVDRSLAEFPAIKDK